MAKTKTSDKRKSSSVKLTKHKTDWSLFRDNKGVRETLIECLCHNDLEAFEDVLVAFLRATSKTKLAKETKLGRRTLYNLIEGKKPFNPTLSTLGPIFKAITGKAA